MPVITDKEFGEIVVKKQNLATRVSLRVAVNGNLRISLPPFAPLFAAKALIMSSRPQIRALLKKHRSTHSYTSDQQIGKSHYLIIRNGENFNIKTSGTQIVVTVSELERIESTTIQSAIHPKIIAALRKEAKSYLPRRLGFLADKYNFNYEKIKFTHASSRWGSCSSRGTISLNVALMNLPFELLDYVIIHELAHTIHMNHSTDFWCLVGEIDHNYKKHRALLKKYTPNI